MKKMLLLSISTVIFPISSFACFDSSSQIVTVEDDTITVIQTANFCLGFGSTCPHIISYNFNVSGNEIIFDAYYDLTGA